MAQSPAIARAPTDHLLRLILLLLAPLALALLGGCSGGGAAGDAKWNGTDVSGSTPNLKFEMTRASDGKTVTQADYRGKIVLLYFGYTYCPDVCPLTLSHIGRILGQVDGATNDVRVLFVTVDPRRDTLDAVRQYVSNFGADMVGLRGSDNALAALAKRYRIAYSVDPDPDPSKYVVSHSSAVYVFDKTGKARLLFTGLSAADADLKGPAADLERLMQE